MSQDRERPEYSGSEKKIESFAMGWTLKEWEDLERKTRTRAIASGSSEAAWRIVIGQARAVLRRYSTSF